MSALVIPLMRDDTLPPLIDEYLRGRVARGELTRASARDIRYCLIQFSDTFGRRPLSQLGRKAVDRWLESIGHRAPATRREYLSRVRTFCRWLQREGHIKTDPTEHVQPIQQPRHVPVTLTTSQVAALLRVCSNARDAAIVQLMVGCGLRCVEIARLRVEDYDSAARTVRVTGKALHQRELPVPADTARAVDAYLDSAGRVAGPLFRSQVVANSGLSSRTLSHYVRRWLRAAGVKSMPRDGRSAHALRRTAGSDVMDRSNDVRVVQAMLGHARIETTAKYYLRPVPLDRLREAMEGRRYIA